MNSEPGGAQTIPAMMCAVQQDQPGGKLVVRNVPVPKAQAGQVLVRMAAAPINPSDLGALMGATYGDERSYPYIPGIEGSGVVIQAGAGLMGRLYLGRRVACAAQTGGTWAEYMVTSAETCIPLNKNVSLEQGAMMLVNPLTALAIFEIAKQSRHRALVSTAPASVLGGMVLRLGKRVNLPVVHIVRRQEQVDLMREQGGEYILNSSAPDFEVQLAAIAKQLQATLLLDAIGGSMTQTLAEAAPSGSTILIYSRLSDENSQIDARTVLVKDLQIKGFFLGNWLAKKNLLQKLLLTQRVQSLLATDLHSKVNKTVPLSAAQEGLEEYIQHMTLGKVLLVADPTAAAEDV